MDNEKVVYKGMRTPWGTAQTARILAPGIGMVNTAGHGGIKLSRERNAQVPKYLRDACSENGWYEEDCACCVPLIVFDQHIREHGPAWLVESLDKYPPSKTLANYWPDQFERYFNRKLALEESHSLREREFKAAHAKDYVVCSAFGDWQNGVPKGMVGVFATIAESRQEPAWSQGKWFLIDAAEYEAREGSFVIDPARHQEVADFTRAA